MKKATLFASILAIFFIGMLNLTAQDLVSTDPQPRNVVLEEFTGIYCGYCPQGHAIAQKLIDDNPGRVLAINIHAGSYANPQQASHPDFRTPWGDALVSYSGLGGFPAGQVNREQFTNVQHSTPGKPAMGRGSWNAAANQVLNSGNSAVNIGAITSWNPNTRILTINVELYYTEDAGVDNLINVAVLENGVVGYQSGGAPDYVHNHILRDLVTGQWGEEVKDTDKGDLVTLQYEYNVNDDWDIKNMDVAVYVSKADRNFIYTGIEIPAIPPPMNVSVSGNKLEVKDEGEPFEKAVTIRNNTGESINITYKLEESDRTPSDWEAEIVSKPTAVAAGQTAEAMISITPGATVGVGDATLTISTTAAGEEFVEEVKISAASPYINKYELITSNNEEDSMVPTIEAGAHTDIFSFKINDFVNIQDDLKVEPELIVVTAGKEGNLSSSTASFLNNMINIGTNVLISGSVPLAQVQFANNNHPLLSTLGARFVSDINQTSFSIVGVKNDPITDGMTISEIDLSKNKYYVSQLNITNNDVASPIFKFQFSGELVGFKSETDMARVVYVGFAPEIITNQSKRTTIIKNSMDWLMAGEAPSAMIEVDMEDIDFGTLEVGATETVTISNTGEADLEITSIEIEGDSEFELFADEDITIAAGEDYEFDVVYTPVETIVNNATITITSNADNMPELTIDVTANSILSVPAGSAGVEGVFTMSVGPNPVANMGNISYTVNSNSSVNVNIYLVDALGNKVADLVNETRAAGTFNATMTTANLSSGVYYLISNANGVNAKLPVVITK